MVPTTSTQTCPSKWRQVSPEKNVLDLPKTEVSSDKTATFPLEHFIFTKINEQILKGKISAPKNFLNGDEAPSLEKSDTTLILNGKPLEIQVAILNQADGFAHWLNTGRRCDEEAVEMSAKDLLKQCNLNYSYWDSLRGTCAREKLLHYLFDQMYQNLSKEEINEFLALLRPLSPPLERVMTNTQRFTQTILSTICSISSNTIGRYAIGVAVCFIVNRITRRTADKVYAHVFNKYVPHLVTPIVKYVPRRIIGTASWMLDHRLQIWLIFFVTDKLLYSIPSSRRTVGIIGTCLETILYLPTKIVELPATMASKLAWRAWSGSFAASAYTAQLAKAGEDRIEHARLAQNIARARDCWEKGVIRISQPLYQIEENANIGEGK